MHPDMGRTNSNGVDLLKTTAIRPIVFKASGLTPAVPAIAGTCTQDNDDPDKCPGSTGTESAADAGGYPVSKGMIIGFQFEFSSPVNL